MYFVTLPFLLHSSILLFCTCVIHSCHMTSVGCTRCMVKLVSNLFNSIAHVYYYTRIQCTQVIYFLYAIDERPTLDELLILKYTDKGEKKRIRIIREACHMWKDIATFICHDRNIIRVLEQKHHGDPQRVLDTNICRQFHQQKTQKLFSRLERIN